jgi:hypothetical protein
MNPSTPSVPALPLQVEDRRFAELFKKLVPFGGMLSGDALRYMHRASQSGLMLGHALLRCDLIEVQWRHSLWLPVFQFQVTTWDTLPNVNLVVAEFFPVLQGFDLAEWFLTPNAWLQNRRPLEIVKEEPEAVVRAAQADRFLLTF